FDNLYLALSTHSLPCRSFSALAASHGLTRHSMAFLSGLRGIQENIPVQFRHLAAPTSAKRLRNVGHPRAANCRSWENQKNPPRTLHTGRSLLPLFGVAEVSSHEV